MRKRNTRWDKWVGVEWRYFKPLRVPSASGRVDAGAFCAGIHQPLESTRGLPRPLWDNRRSWSVSASRNVLFLHVSQGSVIVTIRSAISLALPYQRFSLFSCGLRLCFFPRFLRPDHRCTPCIGFLGPEAASVVVAIPSSARRAVPCHRGGGLYFLLLLYSLRTRKIRIRQFADRIAAFVRRCKTPIARQTQE